MRRMEDVMIINFVSNEHLKIKNDFRTDMDVNLRFSRRHKPPMVPPRF